MKNERATPLGKVFFNNKKTVPQCDNETLGSTAEMLVIQFDQEKFEQLLSKGSSSPINVCKYRKIFMARSPLATAVKQVSDETKEAACRPNSASCKAKQTPMESISVTTETKLALH